MDTRIEGGKKKKKKSFFLIAVNADHALIRWLIIL